MTETWIQWVLGVGLTVVGWVSHMLWQDMKEIRSAHAAIKTDMYNVQLLIAGEYLKRTEFSKFQENIIERLDKILDRIDGKEDKK